MHHVGQHRANRRSGGGAAEPGGAAQQNYSGADGGAAARKAAGGAGRRQKVRWAEGCRLLQMSVVQDGGTGPPLGAWWKRGASI